MPYEINVNISEAKNEDILDQKTGRSNNWHRTRTDDETVIGSTLQAGGNVTITAKSAGNTANPNSGNISITGSNIYSQLKECLEILKGTGGQVSRPTIASVKKRGGIKDLPLYFPVAGLLCGRNPRLRRR